MTLPSLMTEMIFPPRRMNDSGTKKGICFINHTNESSPGAAALLEPITFGLYLRFGSSARILRLRGAFAHLTPMRIGIGAAVAKGLCSFFRNMRCNPPGRTIHSM